MKAEGNMSETLNPTNFMIEPNNGAVARIILKNKQCPQTGGCERISSIRLAFLRPTSTSNGFMPMHIQPPWRVSFKYFPLMVSVLSVPYLADFFSYQFRILQIVTVASLYIMLDVYSKRHEELFRSSVFS